MKQLRLINRQKEIRVVNSKSIFSFILKNAVDKSKDAPLGYITNEELFLLQQSCEEVLVNHDTKDKYLPKVAGESNKSFFVSCLATLRQLDKMKLIRGKVKYQIIDETYW